MRRGGRACRRFLVGELACRHGEIECAIRPVRNSTYARPTLVHRRSQKRQRKPNCAGIRVKHRFYKRRHLDDQTAGSGRATIFRWTVLAAPRDFFGLWARTSAGHLPSHLFSPYLPDAGQGARRYSNGGLGAVSNILSRPGRSPFLAVQIPPFHATVEVHRLSFVTRNFFFARAGTLREFGDRSCLLADSPNPWRRFFAAARFRRWWLIPQPSYFYTVECGPV